MCMSSILKQNTVLNELNLVNDVCTADKGCGDWTRMCVNDTGCGLTPNVTTTIFALQRSNAEER